MTNIWGALIGAALITFLPEWLLFLEDFDILAYGLILLLIAMFLPKRPAQSARIGLRPDRGAREEPGVGGHGR